MPAGAGAPERFSYHRAVAPMVWVLVALASVELLVAHLLVSLLWSRTAALVLSILSLVSIVWLVGTIRSMKRLPVLLDRERLVMRVGTLREVTVPLANVAGLRSAWDGETPKARHVVKLSLIAYPNVIVDLHDPLPGRQGVRTIAHRLDDPAAFTAALERLVGRA